MEPMVLVSDIEIDARNLRQRVRPQRCWLMSRSAITMLSASHGDLSTISAADSSPSATSRLSSALASRTRFARSSARMCCGAGAVAVASMEPPRCLPPSLGGSSPSFACPTTSARTDPPTVPEPGARQRLTLLRPQRILAPLYSPVSLTGASAPSADRGPEASPDSPGESTLNHPPHPQRALDFYIGVSVR